MAKSRYQSLYESLRKEHLAFKQQVSEVVAQCIEEYNLEICSDGLEDFADRLGIPPINKEQEYTLTIKAYVTSKVDLTDAVESGRLRADLASVIEGELDNGVFDVSDVGCNRADITIELS